MVKNKYKSIPCKCKDCGKDFVITPGEQRYFKGIGLELPKRCIDCRKDRKDAKKAAEEKETKILLDKFTFPQIKINDIALYNPSKTLIVIGNGFDIMHGVKSSYWDFQKTIGKNSLLRFYLETYLDTDDLWSSLEESLGKLDYSLFLNSENIDMILETFSAYDPDAQAADFFAAVEMAAAPAFEIPRRLNNRLKKWVKTLSVKGSDRPFSMFYGDYKVLSFNYTEFIEDLYGAKADNICYIHGCRRNIKGFKNNELILGHRPGMEENQWNKVKLKPYKFKNQYKRYIMESASETAVQESAWHDYAATKDCNVIIKNHKEFFDGLSDIEEIYVIGHSLSEVDYPYFREIRRRCDAKWYIGFHSLDDMKRLIAFVDMMRLSKVTVFKT